MKNKIEIPAEYAGREGYYLALRAQAEALINSWADDQPKKSVKTKRR